MFTKVTEQKMQVVDLASAWVTCVNAIKNTHLILYREAGNVETERSRTVIRLRVEPACLNIEYCFSELVLFAEHYECSEQRGLFSHLIAVEYCALTEEHSRILGMQVRLSNRGVLFMK